MFGTHWSNLWFSRLFHAVRGYWACYKTHHWSTSWSYCFGSKSFIHRFAGFRGYYEGRLVDIHDPVASYHLVQSFHSIIWITCLWNQFDSPIVFLIAPVISSYLVAGHSCRRNQVHSSNTSQDFKALPLPSTIAHEAIGFNLEDSCWDWDSRKYYCLVVD